MGIDRYAVSPGGPKGRQAQETETIAHNSVFADHRETGQIQRNVDPTDAGPMNNIERRRGTLAARCFVDAVDPAPAGLQAPGV
jgi:hypothetical protein